MFFDDSLRITYAPSSSRRIHRWGFVLPKMDNMYTSPFLIANDYGDRTRKRTKRKKHLRIPEITRISFFSVVRNPYHRIISEWKYLGCPQEINLWIRSNLQKLLPPFRVKISNSFNIGETSSEKMDLGTFCMGGCHFIPQSDYILWDTPKDFVFSISQNVNYTVRVEEYRILRFESITQDYASLINEYGIPWHTLSNIKPENIGGIEKGCPILEKSSKLFEMLNDESIFLINAVYRKDFEKFHYLKEPTNYIRQIVP